MAGGVAVHQGAQADLVNDALASESLGDHTDHEAEHGGAAIETLNIFELLHMDLGGGSVLVPLAVGGGGGVVHI